MATSIEDLIASDEIEESGPNVSADLNCPICQEVFRFPRRLPCLHSFCQDCLHSHISDTVSVNGPVKRFFCPICGYESSSKEEIPMDKWVLLFPLNTLILPVLMKSKVKLDLVCTVCQNVDVTSPAEDLCTVCEEVLCGNCSKIHKRSRQSTTHTILNLKELPNKRDTVLNNHPALKKTINDALDDLDKRVKEEGKNILQKEKERIEELSHHDFESNLTAIQNANVIVESANKYATQSQMFQLTKAIINQLAMSQRHINKKCSKKNMLTFQLEVSPKLESISAIPRGEIGSDGFKLLNKCIAESLIFEKVQATGDMIPWFTSLTFTKDMHVLLVDYNNQTCNLLDSTYNTITSYQLSGKPWHICMRGDKEVAITLRHDRYVHILSIQDNVITPVRQIPTQYMCYGIVAYNEEELIVSGPCGDGKKYYWSLITLEGKEISYHEFDCRGKSQTYVSLNALKTRLYISVNKDNSLHCFGLDGRKYFAFKHRELKGPQSVALDRDDNVYLLGGEPNNILQLSPDGSLNQIIVEDLQKSPVGICFHQNGDKFVLTHFESANLSVYVLNDRDG
ncbi:hypothetical protein CHS0354_036254 [Potamilus streckersoni]|uniref:Uncharacterized protein n=1 Tax=Potamilus streckersoni TaxID=2493646 RepID=A0AAE0SVZ8_9BIVA|nr:hypothetical protein CHS0354_036254 [Potamilus streckersoni]